MTEEQKTIVIKMRNHGMSFSKIADITGISRNTIKSFCHRQNIIIQLENIADKLMCKQCGAELYPIQGEKAPKFCGKSCRTKWWNSHPEKVNRKAVYNFKCNNCGKEFTAYGNKGRKFCSHECYINSRFKEGRVCEEE